MKILARYLFVVLSVCLTAESLWGFEIDSTSVDEINHTLTVFSNLMDTSTTSVFVTDFKLHFITTTTSGLIFELPDSGKGSVGNITVFSREGVDTLWEISGWNITASSDHELDRDYFVNHGQGFQTPPTQIVTYKVRFRTVNKSTISSHERRKYLFNSKSTVSWNVTSTTSMGQGYYYDFTGSGQEQIDPTETNNYVLLDADSLLLFINPAEEKPYHRRFYFSARSSYTVEEGDGSVSLGNTFAIGQNAFGMISKGSMKFSKYYFAPGDSLVTMTLSWGGLLIEHPYRKAILGVGEGRNSSNLQLSISPSLENRQNFLLFSTGDIAGQLTIYNIQGGCEWTQPIALTSRYSSIQLPRLLPTGVFFYTILGNDKRINGKFYMP